MRRLIVSLTLLRACLFLENIAHRGRQMVGPEELRAASLVIVRGAEACRAVCSGRALKGTVMKLDVTRASLGISRGSAHYNAASTPHCIWFACAILMCEQRAR